jgi:bifunctional non-homologous end joining protein LigD
MAQGLETYNRKRNFAATAEPRGDRRQESGHRFVVQKHAARRLHYDFRLELDGVLKSWAVAKGPSLNPGEKRLAVHVEDHPLEYADFEGTIPAGQYGAGSVMIWDAGTWRPDGDAHAGYAKGHLAFTLAGEKLHGRWNLVRMRPREGERGDNWLLIKSGDEAARPADEPDILEEQPLSVTTGRSIEEIGEDKKSRQWQSRKAASSQAPSVGGAKTPRQRLTESVSTRRRADGVKRTSASAKESANPIPFQFSPPPGARKAALPDFVPPELATLAKKPPVGEWLHEIKFDGYRIQAICRKERVRLLTRKGLDWTNRFPRIAAALESLPVVNALIDGEAVYETADGLSDFSGLQAALKEGGDQRISYYAFDLLYLDGYDLQRVELVDRKTLLESLLKSAPSDALRYSEHFQESGEKMLRHICRLGGEGVVSKRRDGVYRSGRSEDWLKAKCANRQEFVVVGYTPSTAARRAIGSLVLAYWQDGRLTYVGRAGTGYSREIAADLFKLLERERLDKPPVADSLSTQEQRNVKWVRPQQVAEIEFRGWTAAGQLRQASFKALREDKPATEIVREKPISAPNRQMSASAPPKTGAVKLTHPDRILWPDVGVAKQGLADHYARVWPMMERLVIGRPLALLRCPVGADRGCFFQKHAWEGMTESVRRIVDPQEVAPILAIEDFAGVMALVQASVLEIHPWGARVDDLERPDMLIFDLDPGDGVGWTDLTSAARESRERLQKKGLVSFVKTSGGKGLHVVVPLEPRADWSAAKAFCKDLAEAMARDAPQRLVANMSKKARVSRIYVDYLRNGRGATAVAAYSTRARPGAPVSTPLTWEELEAVGDPARFTVNNLQNRLAALRADPWADFFDADQSLP